MTNDMRKRAESMVQWLRRAPLYESHGGVSDKPDEASDLIEELLAAQADYEKRVKPALGE